MDFSVSQLGRGKVKKLFTKIAVGMLVLALVSACANRNEQVAENRDPASANNNEVKTAPMSADQTGYIVKGYSAEQVQSFVAAKDARYRLLHAATNTYEIYDVAEADLKDNFTFVQKNEYIENLVPSRSRTYEQVMQSEDTASVFGVGEVKRWLQNCKRPSPFGDDKGPKPVVSALKHQEKTRGAVTIVDYANDERGIDLSASTSEVFNGKATYAWLVVGPRGSKSAIISSFTDSISFAIDMPGMFEVTMIVKDEGNFCAGTKHYVGVTQNIPFKNLNVRPRWQRDLGKHIKHIAAVQAEEAWLHSKGDGAVVAIIDTGVNYNHPDLNANIWTNTAEIPGNGRDDDGNGYADDVYGWDFAMNDKFAMDDQSHGTHVAGLTASSRTGVAPDATIMPLKAMNMKGGGDIASIVAAVLYAADNGAHIINASFGATHFSWRSKMKYALDYAKDKGVLFVAAAGNSKTDTDAQPVFPGSLVEHENLLTIAATKLNGELASYSNYGKTTVHIGAPGGDRGELLVGPFFLPKKSRYVQMAGTSMASPVTAGVAALAKSSNPSLTALQIKQLILDNGVEQTALSGKTVTGKMVSALAVARAARASR